MTGAFVGRDPARPDDSSIRIGHPIMATFDTARAISEFFGLATGRRPT